MTPRESIARDESPWTVHHVPETGSTNADLLASAEAGDAVDRTVLRTDHQTAGRGRLDRRWDAPPGQNLLVSILFLEPPVMEMPVSLLPQAVGLATVGAVEELADDSTVRDRLGLKWPNDVLLDGDKLSGVLAQRSASTGAVVVGTGINVGWAPDGAAALRPRLGLDVGPAELLDVLLVHLDRLLRTGDLLHRYRQRLSTLGQDVRAELPGGRTIEGIARDVDESGRLIVGDVTLDVGDIVHLRPSTDAPD